MRVTDHPSERVYGVEKFREPAESAEPEDRVRHESVVDQAFVTAANASSLSKEEKINHLGQFRPTHQYYYGFILALLLPALLKVEKVVLDWGTDFDTYYLEEMMARAARREKPFHTQPPFEALTVFVYSHDRFNIPSSDFIALLLRFPAIQKISGRFETLWNHEADRLHKPDSLRYRPSHGDLQDLDSSSSPLTSLNLTVCGLTTTDLGHILRAPKALKTFCYKFCHRHCVDITTDKIRHVLEPQQDCLERIELNCESKRGTDGGNIGSMTSFINFNTLEVLKAPAFFFAATEDINGSERHSLIGIFPHSLKRLHVTRFRGRLNGLVESLEHLLARKSPQQVPSLRKLILDENFDPPLDRSGGTMRVMGMDSSWRSGQTALGGLCRMAAAQGVSFKVIKDDDLTWLRLPGMT